MIIEIIVLIIFLASILGMGMIIIQKIPVLDEIPAEEKIKSLSVFKKFKEKIKNDGVVSGELMLQKFLSKIRILSLKTDSQTSSWLKKLREKSLKKKNNFSENYWEKIRRKK